MYAQLVTVCIFASDLHGRIDRYEKLLAAIEERQPTAVFLGGDLLPFPYTALDTHSNLPADFARDYLAVQFGRLLRKMGKRYPSLFIILGNDDPRADEPAMIEGDANGLWRYCHERVCTLGPYVVCGYACVPPTPFQLKDWERYDVSRYVPPGGVSPEEGRRSVDVEPHVVRYATIKDDLERLTKDVPMERAVFLFHTPPHETQLDRVATDGKVVDHVPLDLHVGSVAVRRFVETRQPVVTLHGHIHESARLTGSWRDRLGRTHAFSAAHDGPELALVSFDLTDLESATRELL
ncbi:MAG: metallophosphoesterase [Candidatus Latescibacterota bacterium]|nr:MAG: metallophosphoesterase [Candidatus Latescibacterota bacterium]